MTSVLFTIEETRVDSESRRAMARAGIAPVYRPLRELREVEPDEDGLRAILAADTVIVTSGFALKVYLAHPRWRDPERPAPQRRTGDGEREHSPALIVLSARMADEARAAGIRHVLVPNEENQRGVAKLLATLRDGARRAVRDSSRGGLRSSWDGSQDSITAAAHAVHLCGSLSTPHDTLPADVARVQVYENHWDAACEDRACEIIADTPGTGGGIGRILVTSPSAYLRLRSIMGRIPACFADRPTYYTLGPSTTEAVEADGGEAVPPGTHTDVLHAAIGRLIGDVTGA